jgi:hypothetical protein
MKQASRTPSFLPQNPNISSLKIKNAGSLQLYNTASQADFDSLLMNWASNVANIFTAFGGAGAARILRVGASATQGGTVPSTYIQLQRSSVPYIVLSSASGGGTGILVELGSVTSTAASGAVTAAAITPTINQSGTASYTALDVNPTESTVGSGTRLLQRWAVGGSARAQLTSAGTFYALGNIMAGSTTNSLSTLESLNSFGAGIASVAIDTTLSSAHFTLLVDASGAARVITLPAATARRIYVVKKIDSSGNTVTIDGNASETIDGALTKVLSAQYASVMIQSDGTNWHILSAS